MATEQTKKDILLVDDDVSHRIMLRANLESDGYHVFEAENGEMAVDLVSGRTFDCVLMDVRMPVMDGMQALVEMQKVAPSIPVVMMTAYGSIKTAVEALKSGAEDYLLKPVNVEELLFKVGKIMDFKTVEAENVIFRERLKERFDFSSIIGRSSAIRELFEILSMVSPTDATVLILGESGTGKELVANAIHQNEDRKDKPFIKVNCAALPENLLESELFGHEKGAFTGAVTRKEGRFKVADGGTIFLDEIAEMSKATQAKILRVLQEREFEPLGSNDSVRVDVRVIAATNRDLEKEVELGNFREDLYYRLNVVPVRVPPLRERREDIPLLLDHFLSIYCGKIGKKIRGFEPEAVSLLSRYAWPGNVRELENVVERTVIMCRGEYIETGILPGKIGSPETPVGDEPGKIESGITLREAEKRLIVETLRETGGNRTHTAEILGITRKTLFNKIKEFEIEL
jgi:two-component system response regulator HydG